MDEIFPDTAEVSSAGHLLIGERDCTELAERFGTPLLVFDRATFEARATAFASALSSAQVFYAGKAFCCTAIVQLLGELGLGLDVCSGGELATAAAARFPPERIMFHGNNKSAEELEMARALSVGRIVVDSFEEIDLLEKVGVRTRILVRVTPGVEAHTHEFVQTGQEDSKFGFGYADGTALEAMKRVLEIPGCTVTGVHAHIGSQIFDLTAFDLAIRRLAELCEVVRTELEYEIQELNLGGGLGIAHTGDEMTPEPAESINHLTAAVGREFSGRGIPVPQVLVEPGRSMVGASCVTVYRVGTVKRIPGVRTYVSVDGGMSDNVPSNTPDATHKVFVAVDGGMGDNLRPALYGARYETFLANRMQATRGIRADVVGRYCESGDFLVKNAHLPGDVAPGDLLCIPATGAYTYSMASNYNRVPRPAVVMVERGRATEIIRRETYNDLLRLDRGLDGGTRD